MKKLRQAGILAAAVLVLAGVGMKGSFLAALTL